MTGADLLIGAFWFGVVLGLVLGAVLGLWIASLV